MINNLNEYILKLRIKEKKFTKIKKYKFDMILYFTKNYQNCHNRNNYYSFINCSCYNYFFYLYI